MKKFSYFTGALSTLILGATALTAQPCSSNWNNNCCDWSFCDGKVIAGADWLYWQAEQSNMDFLSLSTSTGTIVGITATATTNLDDSVLSLDRNYESGYRVYLGYELPSNGWEFAVVYSNMPVHAALSTPELVTGQSIELNANFNDVFTPSFASAKWDANLNNIDLDIAHTISFGECFRLRPHIGFRATWMDQKYKYNFDNVLLPNAVQYADAGKFSEKLNGYGVEGGLFANWNIGCGFSLVGHVGGSLLYSEIKIHQTELLTNAILDEAYSNRSKLHLGTPSLDYFVGLEYSSSFCETALSAYVGWEQHVLFDVNQLFGDNDSGNLYLQGLTLGVNAAF